MALQDLTPQLRTRLSRMERAVGWFVLLATLLLAFGFGYYVYTTAERKGWFKGRATYYTFADRATGIKVGDPVNLMGFTAGQITKVTAQPPEDWENNVYIEFAVIQPYYDYLWTQGSRAQFMTANVLGGRVLEVIKGTSGYPAYLFFPLRQVTVNEARGLPSLDRWRLAQEIYDASGTNLLVKAEKPLSPQLLDQLAGLAGDQRIRVADTRKRRKHPTAVWNEHNGWFEPFGGTNLYYLPKDETPALTERAERLLSQVEAALPSFLNLTNSLGNVLSNSADLTANLSRVAEQVRPAVSNLNVITAQLRDPKGSLGEWLIPTNMHAQLDTALHGVNVTLTNANADLATLAGELSRSLDSVANITSNLNRQVEVNTNILSQISDAIVHSDQFVQGLKHHWLLRSAFKTPKTNAPPSRPVQPARSPKDAAEHGP